MSDRTNSIAIIALIGAVLALVITVVLNLCPTCAEKKLNVSAKDDTTKFSEELANQSLRLSQIERSVSQLETRIGSVPAPIGNQATFEPYVWTQLYPDAMLQKGIWKIHGSGDMIARAIVAAGQACPKIVVNGQSVFLVPRSIIYPTLFPVTLCETAQPFSGNSQVAFGLKSFRPWTSEPKRILVIGDTGCRVTFYGNQDCTHVMQGENRWPFPRIVESVLKEKERVDLIIHVGDYHYRERPCPAGKEAFCGTTDWGYNWPSWQVDFFEPARRLLAEAPWIFVRGNHENCDRAGTGWTNFLWPTLRDEGPKSCQDYHEPYIVRLAAALSLAILDVANSEEPDIFSDSGKAAIKLKVDERLEKHKSGQTDLPSNRALLYQVWMERLAESQPEGKLWIAMQQPPWQWPFKDDLNPSHAYIRDASVKAIQDALLAWPRQDSIELVLAGDTHAFETLRFNGESPLPWVVVSGMGGDNIDKRKAFSGDESKDTITLKLGNHELSAFLWNEYGYTILEMGGDGIWQARVSDETGVEAFSCRLARDSQCPN